MSIERMSAPELLGLNRFTVDEEEPHIVINKEICAKCQEKPCLCVCPAGLYKLDNMHLYQDNWKIFKKRLTIAMLKAICELS